MSEEKKMNAEELEQVTGGHDGMGYDGGWTYGTVHGVVYYDSSSCLTLRDYPGGNVQYTDAGRPMGWDNGDSILVKPSSRTGNWIRANYYGVIGWVNANYVWY